MKDTDPDLFLYRKADNEKLDTISLDKLGTPHIINTHGSEKKHHRIIASLDIPPPVLVALRNAKEQMERYIQDVGFIFAFNNFGLLNTLLWIKKTQVDPDSFSGRMNAIQSGKTLPPNARPNPHQLFMWYVCLQLYRYGLELF